MFLEERLQGLEKYSTKVSQYLPNKIDRGGSYTTNYLQLGYIKCALAINSNHSNITLLVSSSFYDVQHWSTHLITLAQARSVKANYLKLGGSSRGFYYKIDNANNRIYLYARASGGNGFGVWQTRLINNMSCEWVQETAFAVEKTDDWVEITAVA